MTLLKRLSARWVAETLGVAAVVAAAFLTLSILGYLTLGIALIAEASLGEPFRPTPKD